MGYILDSEIATKETFRGKNMQTRKFNLRGRIVCTQTIEAYEVVVGTGLS